MDPNITTSITVDRALFDQFLAWQREQEQQPREVEQAPPAPAPAVAAPWPANVGVMDAHGFVPTTMQVSAHEGGRFGTPDEPEQDDADATQQDDQQADVPYRSPIVSYTNRSNAATTATPNQVRSPRVSPSVADAYVIEAMKHYPHSNAFTIRPPRYVHSSDALTDDPKTGAQGAVSQHTGVALSVAQVRAALDRLATAGRVYKHGKNGKQDRWYLKGDQFDNPTR